MPFGISPNLYEPLSLWATLLLLLVLDKFDLILWYLLVLLQQKLLQLIADSTMHNNFLSTARKLGN